MKTNLYLILFAVTFFLGCKKVEFKTVNEGNQSLFISSAAQYLKNNLPESVFNSLDFNSPQLLTLKGENIGMKIFDKGGSHDNFILLKKQSNTFSANWVQISGLASTQSLDHNGTILLQSLDKKNSTKFIVQNNKVVGYGSNSKDASANVYKVLPEVVVTSYIGGVKYDFWSLYWLFNQDPFYNDYYDAGNYYQYSGGGGGQSSTVVAAPTISSPATPVLNVKDEVKCFTNNSSSGYSVSVNVNQPEPGTREVFDPSSTFPVGHTFLTLEQDNPDGSKIIRNLGFYPRNGVKPGSAVDQSTFGEDSQTPYDISLKINLSGSDFTKLINSLISQQSLNYDLNNFNCTNSPMNALGTIGIELPATKSNSLLFNGYDPADLGEDIRGLNLDSFSADNGGRKISRTTSAGNTQKPSAKTGGC